MTTSAQLGIAIRAFNEASKTLKEIQDDVEQLDAKVEENTRQLGDMNDRLTGIGDAGGNAEQALRGVSDITGLLGEQVGINLGPLNEYAGVFGQLGGGVEALLKGGPAFITQLKSVPGAMVPAIASSWAYVSALTAQAVAFIAANAPIIALVAGIALLVAGVLIAIKYWDEIVEKVPFLGTAATAVKDVVVEAWEFVKGAFTGVLDFVRDHWPEIAVLISGPFAPIVLLATDAFGVRSALTGAFGATRDFVSGVVGEIVGFVSGIPGSITALAGDMLSAGTSLGSSLFDGLKGALSDTAGFAGDVGQAVLDAVKRVVNTYVIGPINSALEFSIPVPLGPDIHINPPDIPRLAAGGIVTRPTLALIGEAGPEAVVPLNRGGSFLGGGPNITIHIAHVDARTPDEAARAADGVARGLAAALRARGLA